MNYVDQYGGGNAPYVEIEDKGLRDTIQSKKTAISFRDGRGKRLLPSRYGQPGIKSGDLGSYDRPVRVSTLGLPSSARGDKSYDDLKQELLASGKLWEDPDFPAVDESLYFSKSPPRKIEWLRPREICNNPKFFVQGATRFDIIQGELGDCWLLAAVASLTLNPKLLARVVPLYQSFADGDYCGAFHFKFWRFGTWVDVIVDDRLPTHHGELEFLHSEKLNEFWTALLEKAYAKLHGSYESLKGGSSSEAMTDFTGGITEHYELEKAPDDLFNLMCKSLERQGMLGCSVDPVDNIVEAALDNGLICGHAYSVTACALPYIETPKISGKVPLVRVRNPWGEAEWRGAFSDRSTEWQLISEEDKVNMGLTCDEDGEFWMSYWDFIDNFHEVQMTNLGPDVWGDDTRKKKWDMKLIEGSWRRGYNAGGCRNNRETFHTNPQFKIILNDPDEDDEERKCTCVIALMQKDRRAKSHEGKDLLTIGFAIYELKGEYKHCREPLGASYFEDNGSVALSIFINLREVSTRLRLLPGTYVILPSTFDANKEAEFIMRVFTEKVNVTEHIDEESRVDLTAKPPPLTPDDAKQAQKLGDAFGRIAGDDMEIDYLGLKEVLDTVLVKEFQSFNGFSSECCRSMVAMVDTEHTGKVGLNEFWKLWRILRLWKTIFNDHDKDYSGSLSTFELRQALRSAGYRLGSDICKTIVLRYGNFKNEINFDDFLLCAVKLKTLETKYEVLKPADVSLEEWLEASLYC